MKQFAIKAANGKRVYFAAADKKRAEKRAAELSAEYGFCGADLFHVGYKHETLISFVY